MHIDQTEYSDYKNIMAEAAYMYIFLRDLFALLIVTI